MLRKAGVEGSGEAVQGWCVSDEHRRGARNECCSRKPIGSAWAGRNHGWDRGVERVVGGREQKTRNQSGESKDRSKFLLALIIDTLQSAPNQADGQAEHSSPIKNLSRTVVHACHSLDIRHDEQALLTSGNSHVLNPLFLSRTPK